MNIESKRNLDADGVISIYTIKTGEVIAQYQGVEVHEKLLEADKWKKERDSLLEMTSRLDEHPKGYEGPCLCSLCQSYF